VDRRSIDRETDRTPLSTSTLVFKFRKSNFRSAPPVDADTPSWSSSEPSSDPESA
jgi:hypothetical protein